MIDQHLSQNDIRQLTMHPKLAWQFSIQSKKMLAIVSGVVALAFHVFIPQFNGWLNMLSVSNSPRSPLIAAQHQDEGFVALPLESKEMDAYFSNSENVPRVRGKLIGHTRKDLSNLVIKYVIQVPSKLQRTHVVKIDRNGHFDLNLTYPFPYQELMLIVEEGSQQGKSERLLFSAFIVHQELTIQLDLKKLRQNRGRYTNNGVSFSGESASLVEYQMKYWDEFSRPLREVYLKRSTAKSKHPTDIEKLLATTEETFADEAKLIDKFIAGNPSKHAWVLKDRFHSSYHAEIVVCHVTTGSLIPNAVWRKALAHQPKAIGASSTDYYHNLNLAVGSYDRAEFFGKAIKESFTDPSERAEIDRYVQMHGELIQRKQLGQKELSEYKTAQEKYLEPSMDRLKGMVLENHLAKLKQLEPRKANVVMVLGAAGVSNSKGYIQAILPMVQDSWCKTLLMEEYEEDAKRISDVQNAIKRAMAKGADGLGDELFSSDGTHMYHGNQNTAEEVVAALVKSFPDKAIIVDFWSMSCGACLRDMQDSKETKAKLAELPVEIVYVCLDSEYERWVETIAGSGIKGNHLFLNKKLSGAVSEHFEVSSLPHFIFIDQDRNCDSNLIRFLTDCDVSAIKSKLKNADDPNVQKHQSNDR